MPHEVQDVIYEDRPGQSTGEHAASSRLLVSRSLS